MRETAQYTYADDLQGLPLLQARFHQQHFSRHVHEGYCIGVIDQGAQRFFRSGANHIAAQDSIILVNPDQVHDGHSATEGGWSYKAIYPLPQMLFDMGSEFRQQHQGTPLFASPVVEDPWMANQLRCLFQILSSSDNSLQRESCYLQVMAILLKRHAKQRYEPQVLLSHPRAIQQAREYIDAHFQQQISTRFLAQLVGLNPYYLTRLFQQSLGLPPHAYQIQKRLQLAHRLIRQHMPLIQVADLCGFSDQSHLNRHFKKWLGITPGQLKKQH